MVNLSKKVTLQVDRAIKILRAGGIVVYPTDTVYGLGCNALNSEAVERIYRVKQRPSNQPLPVLLADVTELDVVVQSVPEIARFLISRFWPGGLTVVLPKTASVPSIVTAGSDKVAVRIPNHVAPITIIRGLDAPIIGTSANISDKPSPVTPEEVKQQLGDAVDLIIDAGRCPGGIESTVVDFMEDKPIILRQGIISEDEIRRACQEYAEEVSKCA